MGQLSGGESVEACEGSAIKEDQGLGQTVL
jgi:hypothetical protein